jgi:hypothetical protein
MANRLLRPVYVVAGDWKQYLTWLRVRDDRLDGYIPFYIQQPEDLFGLAHPMIAYSGTYTQRKDWPRIQQIIHTIPRVEVWKDQDDATR